MENELKEKCRLTDEEIDEIENEYPRKFGLGITVAKAQLAKAIPLISAEARKRAVDFIESYLVTTVHPEGNIHHIDDKEWQSVKQRVLGQALKEGGKEANNE